MKKTMLLMLFAILLIPPAVSCEKQNDEQSGNTIVYSDDYRLNDRQKSILTAEGLSTDFSKLDISQKRSIQRIEQMLCYLETNYGTEFVYSGYIEQGINESEKLYAYPKNIGTRQTVTIKANGDGFTDNYFDFSVEKLAEELTNEFLTEHFGDSYKYFVSPLACEIKMSEIEDGKFQWKYGAENQIFLLEELCSIDNVEEFAVEYAKFLYEHELSGSHRIEVLKEFPEDEEIWARKGVDLYGSPERWSTGFYCLSSNASFHTPTVFNTDYHKYDQDAEWYLAEEFDITKVYTIEEYFAKYD